MTLDVRRLGLVPFDEAWALQRELAAKVTPNQSYLLLLEHPPIFTLGKNGKESNVLDPHGIPVCRIDRGGDVTYHGPGQLVGYPIVDIRLQGVRRFVRSMEKSLMGLLEEFAIGSRRRDCGVGLWAEKGKIASIGLRVSRGITTHGFALNVCNDLTPFGYVNPCGEQGGAATSMSEEVGGRIEVDEVIERLNFGLRGNPPRFFHNLSTIA